MQIIPSTPHRTGSRAELRVFDRLRTAFANDTSLRLTAFHSLNLPRHEYKRFGEIDFLIVGRPGIYVLEVKGGGVACRNGVWTFTDRSGSLQRLRESPFRQAASALYGLMAKLRDALPDSVLSQFTIGYGVILPDCDWDVGSAEWDRAVLADARTSRNLESWLSGLFRHWRERDPGRHRGPDCAALDALKHHLRPELDVAVPLHVQLNELAERVAALTDDQMRLLDVVDANRRVICSGGAGTGKTFLALELARRWAASGCTVLLACRSPWLKRWLETRFVLPGVSVSIAAAASTAARRNGIQRFEALIVDEGQDLLSMDLIDRLDAVLDGGLEHGRWCFFHDLNNQSGFFGPADPHAWARIEAHRPARVPLTTNCRNTRQILNKVQSTLGADMGVRGSGDGPEVREQVAETRADAARILDSEIERLTVLGGLSPSEITILSGRPFAESAAAGLSPGIRSRVLVLDEYALRHFPPPHISFAEIADFRGLENEAILLVDIPQPSGASASNPRHYVGMSRARSLLTTIYTARGHA